MTAKWVGGEAGLRDRLRHRRRRQREVRDLRCHRREVGQFHTAGSRDKQYMSGPAMDRNTDELNPTRATYVLFLAA